MLGVLATLVQAGNASVYVHLADHGLAGIDRQGSDVCVDVVGVGMDRRRKPAMRLPGATHCRNTSWVFVVS